jgi:hypothetical protein
MPRVDFFFMCPTQNRTVKFKDEVEEFEPDPEADAEEAHQQELRQQRRAMLVQTLKNNKGRKRFMEWLYRCDFLGYMSILLISILLACPKPRALKLGLHGGRSGSCCYETP